MEHRTEEGVPLLKLQCTIVTHRNTGVYNDATNQTINYRAYQLHNTDGGDKKSKR